MGKTQLSVFIRMMLSLALLSTFMVLAEATSGEVHVYVGIVSSNREIINKGRIKEDPHFNNFPEKFNNQNENIAFDLDQFDEPDCLRLGLRVYFELDLNSDKATNVRKH